MLILIWSSKNLLEILSLKKHFLEEKMSVGCVVTIVTLQSTDHKGLFEYIKEGIGME